MSDHTELERKLQQAVRAYCNQIEEYLDADTVQIFVTKTTKPDNETLSAADGVGNSYARKGQVNDWLTEQKSFIENSSLEDAFWFDEDEE